MRRGTGPRSSAGSARGSAHRRHPFHASSRCISSPCASSELARDEVRTARPSRAAASSANARENSRSPVAVASRRPPEATTVGRPDAGSSRRGRRRGRASRRAPARPLRRRAPVPRSLAAGRPQPGTRATAAAACRRRRSSRRRSGERLAMAAREPAIRPSTRSISRGTAAPPASSTAWTAGSLRHRPRVNRDDPSRCEHVPDIRSPPPHQRSELPRTGKRA